MPFNTDFIPYMQRAKDAKPDVLFVFIPAGRQATQVMKAYGDLGLDKAGIKFIGPGDIVTDEELPSMGDVPLGVIGITPGPMQAAVDRVEITITGQGGHGARPHQTVDPVLVAAIAGVAVSLDEGGAGAAKGGAAASGVATGSSELHAQGAGGTSAAAKRTSNRSISPFFFRCRLDPPQQERPVTRQPAPRVP